MKSYKLPKNLYFQTLWFIRRYEESKGKLQEFSEIRGVSYGGIGGGSGISDSTALNAIKKIELKRDVESIERALCRIPMGYRKGIWRNIQEREPFPDHAGEATWKRWKRRFVYFVAEERGWL